MGFQLESGVHRVHETPLAKFLRKETRNEELITFYDGRRGKWVLAYWINKEHGFVHDVDDLDGDIETGPLMCDWLQKSLSKFGKKQDKEALKGALKERDRAEFRQFVDKCAEQRDLRKYLRKKTGQGVYYG